MKIKDMAQTVILICCLITIPVFVFAYFLYLKTTLDLSAVFEKSFSAAFGFFGGAATLAAAYIASRLFNDWRLEYKKNIEKELLLKIIVAIDDLHLNFFQEVKDLKEAVDSAIKNMRRHAMLEQVNFDKKQIEKISYLTKLLASSLENENKVNPLSLDFIKAHHQLADQAYSYINTFNVCMRFQEPNFPGMSQDFNDFRDMVRLHSKNEYSFEVKYNTYYESFNKLIDELYIQLKNTK